MGEKSGNGTVQIKMSLLLSRASEDSVVLTLPICSKYHNPDVSMLIIEVLIYRFSYQLLLVSQRNSTMVQPIGKENQTEH